MSSMPEKWIIKSLGEVAKTTSGGTPSRKNKSYFGGEIQWFKSGELNDGIILDSEETITKEGLDCSNCKLFPAGTLLIAMYGATVGKIGILKNPAATNQAICAIFPLPNLDRNYLFWFLRYKRKDLIYNSFGAAQPNISQAVIRNIEIPVPPIDEQRRIVARIEELIRRAEEARKLRQKVSEKIALTVSSFIDNQLNSLPKEIFKPIGDHAKLQGGFAFKSEWFCEVGMRLLRNQNIYHDKIDWGKEKTVHLPEEMVPEFDRFALYEGDIVLTMDRPLIKSGLKASRVRSKDLPCLLLQRVGRFVCSYQINPDYLFLCLLSQIFTSQISSSERSNAVPHISSKQVEAVLIPVPEKHVQIKIVQQYELFRDKFEHLKTLQDEVDVKLEKFQSALLAKAFWGEL